MGTSSSKIYITNDDVPDMVEDFVLERVATHASLTTVKKFSSESDVGQTMKKFPSESNVGHRPEVEMAHGSNSAKTSSGKSVKSVDVLRSFAFRHYSQQSSHSVPDPDVMSTSFIITHKSSFNVSKGALIGAGHSKQKMIGSGSALTSILENKKNNSSIGREMTGSTGTSAATTTPGTSGTVALPPAGVGMGGMGLKLNLNLKLHIEDDDDWIQVSDDEDDHTAHTHSKKKDTKAHHVPKEVGTAQAQQGFQKPQLTLSKNQPTDQSYVFTTSGTLFMDGFMAGGIGTTGIRSSATTAGTGAGSHAGPTAGTGGLPPSGSHAGGPACETKCSLPIRERLVILCQLGQGASGVVYKALDLSTMKLVALKIIPVFERSKRHQMAIELSSLYHILASHKGKQSSQKANHEYIVDFYDAFSLVDEGGIALMMEYMDGGSLQSLVDGKETIAEETLGNIAVQALTGLMFLHDCGQIHRDLKPGNFLINNNGEVKIADLGILKQLKAKQATSLYDNMTMEEERKDEESEQTCGGDSRQKEELEDGLMRANTFIGTATYMSPERIDGKEYSLPSDIWAFGLSLISIATGKLPIVTDSGGYWTILNTIRDQPPPALPNNGQWSDDFINFIDQCMQKDAAKRSTCKQLINHPFILKAKASLESGCGGTDVYVLDVATNSVVRESGPATLLTEELQNNSYQCQNDVSSRSNSNLFISTKLVEKEVAGILQGMYSHLEKILLSHQKQQKKVSGKNGGLMNSSNSSLDSSYSSTGSMSDASFMESLSITARKDIHSCVLDLMQFLLFNTEPAVVTAKEGECKLEVEDTAFDMLYKLHATADSGSDFAVHGLSVLAAQLYIQESELVILCNRYVQSMSFASMCSERSDESHSRGASGSALGSLVTTPPLPKDFDVNATPKAFHSSTFR